MKAKYKISLVRPEGDGYSSLSNMNQISEEAYGEGLVKTTFAESVPMSTYLTVFIVSDFASISETINPSVGDEFVLRAFSTPAQVSKLDFAMKTAVSVIQYYIDYFQVPYPLPKLDMAAIPGELNAIELRKHSLSLFSILDFVSGAMETWGLVTYRETSLLYDPAISSSTNKQRVAAVIAHEFAHMWFGNLVSMRWWDSLYLNEGFASYIEFKGINAALPEWQIEEQFTIDTMHSVLNNDAKISSHPIVVGVETPDQITEIFDSITYNKGASVIRMLEDFIGPENFRQGVSEYLEANKYGNTDSDDLLAHLKDKVEDLDVTGIFNTWIRQKGYPVVNVVREGNTYKLTQNRFLTDPDSASQETLESEYNYRWSIPITFITSKNSTVQREWFHPNMNEVVIAVDGDEDWIKFNKDQVGYYRVKYEDSMWQSLNAALEADIDTMTVLDRAHLLNDVFSLAEGTQVPYSIALTMTQYLKKEDNFVPWDVASSKLKTLRNLLYYTDLYSGFKTYANNLVNESYHSINWTVDPEAHLDK